MKKYLGVEFGSTRIKAVTIDEDFEISESGEYFWASKYENGIWTYSLDDVWKGLKAAISGISDLDGVSCLGISAMMHGYLAFDKNWNLLVPFRTWQNTITEEAALKLTELFDFNIPQRWSIAHLYQAILNNEEHVGRIAHITTLAGYVHYKLTGINAVGIGEASGMFPIDSETLNYNADMLNAFDEISGQKWKVNDVLPAVLVAGADAGVLTDSGSALLDERVAVGTAFAPCEGDAGTGMSATNSVSVRTGNISAGTSIFSMVVLDAPLSRVHDEIDMVTTPSGAPVAMIHCNNCTQDFNAWQPLFGRDFSELYKLSIEGDADCGGVTVCNYLSGEGVTHINSGVPLVTRTPDSDLSLANLSRAFIYSSFATLKMGMDILADEGVEADLLIGHGGIFKTKGVAQKYMASALNVPVACMETAGEGGPYGMALLAAFKDSGYVSLSDFLSEKVFCKCSMETMLPDEECVEGYKLYIERFKKLIEIERCL